MWYIYTKEHHTAIKRNEIGSFVDMWMDLESVIQNEVSHISLIKTLFILIDASN